MYVYTPYRTTLVLAFPFPPGLRPLGVVRDNYLSTLRRYLGESW